MNSWKTDPTGVGVVHAAGVVSLGFGVQSTVQCRDHAIEPGSHLLAREDGSAEVGTG